MLLFTLLVYTETIKEVDLRFSGLRARTAGHGGTSVHERRLPAVGSSRYSVQSLGEMLTSFSRLASGHIVRKSTIVPCFIHSETIIKV